MTTNHWQEFEPEEVLQRVDHDLEFLAEMVAMLPENTAEGLSWIERTMAQGDAEGLGPAAHRLKGSLAIMTTGRSYQLARRIEECPVESRLQEAAVLWPELNAAVTALEYELNAYLVEQGVSADLA